MSLFTPSRRWQPAFLPVKRERLSRRILAGTERIIKGSLFGCRMCGNCLLQETAFICPMECPKGLRNGPCGGSSEGKCYVDPTRKCIWHSIFERSGKMTRQDKLLEVLPPLDWNKVGTETWGEVVRAMRKAGSGRFIHGVVFPKGRNGALASKVFHDIRQPSWWQGDQFFHPPGYSEPASKLEARLRQGGFVVTTEVMPPLHADIARLKKSINEVSPYVAAVNFTDNSSSVPRMSGLVCSSIAASMGEDPVLQIAARDNTRYSVQSKAIGSNAAGIFNILCITGDSPLTGPAPVGNMNIVDLDSVQMLWMLRKMRDEGKYLDGRDIKYRPKYFLGAAASPCASIPSFQAIREEKKVNAGAQFLQTNIIYDYNRLCDWLAELDKRGVLGKAYILIGVAPLRSHRMALHLSREVPGVTVPDEILKRMEKAGDTAEETGINIALEFIAKVKLLRGVSGIHLMPLGCDATVGKIVNSLHGIEKPDSSCL
ncbi:MAG: methylenetetrahydrofolate reductase C-terminal domain-containing protein [Bacteroidales bacterium]